jgi:hypothetical protein
MSDFVKIVSSVSLPRFPFPIKLEVADRGSAFELRIIAYVPDRDTGRQTTVFRIEVLDREHCEMWSPESVIAMIRAFLMDILAHELDEHLLINGVRRVDPHAGGLCRREAQCSE